MDFSPSALLADFIFGALGLWILGNGIRKVDFRIMFTGIGLMAYTYFVPGQMANWIIGVLLCGLARYFWVSG